MEGFFQVCVRADDETDVKELILRRYNNIEYILSMEVYDFLIFLEKALKKEEEERIRLQWISMLPYMSMKSLEYISFEQYYEQCTGGNIDLRPAEEIMEDIREAHRRAGKEVEF